MAEAGPPDRPAPEQDGSGHRKVGPQRASTYSAMFSRRDLTPPEARCRPSPARAHCAVPPTDTGRSRGFRNSGLSGSSLRRLPDPWISAAAPASPAAHGGSCRPGTTGRRPWCHRAGRAARCRQASRRPAPHLVGKHEAAGRHPDMPHVRGGDVKVLVGMTRNHSRNVRLNGPSSKRSRAAGAT